MLKTNALEHQFVETIPEVLDPGVLYVSMEFGIVTHLCCCGCGEEVVTPLTPTEWKLTYDGEAISIWPSVGNWNFACRSHYVIRGGKVLEADAWSEQRIAAERKRDKAAKAAYYVPADNISVSPETMPSGVKPTAKPDRGLGVLLRWLKDRLR